MLDYGEVKICMLFTNIFKRSLNWTSLVHCQKLRLLDPSLQWEEHNWLPLSQHIGPIRFYNPTWLWTMMMMQLLNTSVNLLIPGHCAPTEMDQSCSGYCIPLTLHPWILLLWGYIENIHIPPMPTDLPGLRDRIWIALESMTSKMLSSMWEETDYKRIILYHTKSSQWVSVIHKHYRRNYLNFSFILRLFSNHCSKTNILQNWERLLWTSCTV